MVTLMAEVLGEPGAGRALNELRRVLGASAEGGAEDAEPEAADVLPLGELDLSQCTVVSPSYRVLPVCVCARASVCVCVCVLCCARACPRCVFVAFLLVCARCGAAEGVSMPLTSWSARADKFPVTALQRADAGRGGDPE